MENSAELDLIARILQGETSLFHDLIGPHERAAYLAALSVIKNEADAEDIAQEAILKAYRALGGFRGESRFRTWLISIVINEARGRIRQKTRLKMESLDGDDPSGENFTPFLVADWREIPSEVLERGELAAMIEDAIANLAPAYREVFLLRDKDELSIDEIAAVMGITPGLVKVRLFRARMLLQKRLAPYLKREVAVRRPFLSWLGGRS